MLLEGGHLADHILDDLGRQLLQHLVLSSSQDERGDALLQALQCVYEILGFLKLLTEPLDVGGEVLVVFLVKKGLLLEESGHEEVKDGPQFGDLVLQGRPSQHKLLLALERLYGLGRLGLGVFYDVRLIQGHIEKLQGAQLLNVSPNLLIAGDNHIELTCLGVINDLSSLQGVSLVNCHAHPIEVLTDLYLPVVGDGRGAHNQVDDDWVLRSGALFLFFPFF
jgi:hypothetical protein